MPGFGTNPGFESSVSNPNISGLSAATRMGSRNVDHHGNLWLFAELKRLRCFAQNGTILQTYSEDTDIVPLLLTYIGAHGGGITNGSPGLNNGACWGVVGTGATKYLVYTAAWYQSGTTYFHVMALFAMDAAGALTVKAVVWTGAGVSSALGMTIDQAGLKTDNDPIVAWYQSGSGPIGHCFAKVWPSITSLLNSGSGRCSGIAGQSYGFANSSSQGQTNYNLGAPSVNSYGSSAGGSQPAFFLPGASGKTTLFIYVGKSSMANNHALIGASDTYNGCVFIDNQYGTYPNGCMIAADFGTLVNPAYTTASDTFNTVTPAVVPGCLDGANAFPDVGTNYDGTGTHTSNDYFATPSLLQVTGGLCQVAWYRPTFIDDSYTDAGLWSVLAKARVMSYDPSTGAFTTSFLTQGALAPIASIGSPNTQGVNFIDIYNYVLFWSGGVLKAWHADEGSATSSGALHVWLAHFGANLAGQVTVTVRIGAGGSAAPTAPVNTVLPSIQGVPHVGETLTADVGTWTGNP